MAATFSLWALLKPRICWASGHRGTLKPNLVWFECAVVAAGTVFSTVSVHVLEKLLLPCAFWSKLAPVSPPERVLARSSRMSLGWLLGATLAAWGAFLGCPRGLGAHALANP